jgi:hypothetical protein
VIRRLLCRNLVVRPALIFEAQYTAVPGSNDKEIRLSRKRVIVRDACLATVIKACDTFIKKVFSKSRPGMTTQYVLESDCSPVREMNILQALENSILEKFTCNRGSEGLDNETFEEPQS